MQTIKRIILRKSSVILFLFVLALNAFAQEKLAIPDAMGFGKYVKGAYAGSSTPAVLIVDRLTDDNGNDGANKGSLRWCLSQSFPRIILFEVSGYINLKNYINVTNSYVSIYGQTAPSPGITISGVHSVIINCNNVLIQHLRFRPSYVGSGSIDALSLNGGSNVFVDHCSFSYAEDECVGIGLDFRDNVTFQNCIFYQGLNYQHSKGILINAGSADKISIIRTAFVHCATRTPLPNSSGYSSFEVINTMSYNNAYFGIVFAQGNNPKVSVIGNEWRPGNNTSGLREVVRIDSDIDNEALFFLKDNYTPKEDNSSAEWENTVSFESASHDTLDFYSNSPFEGYETNIMRQSELEEYLMNYAGARYWDRDEVDEIALNDLKNGTGRWITEQSEAYYPPLEQNVVALKLPDDLHSDNNNNGFSNLEDWVHSIPNGSPCSGLTILGDITNSDQGQDNGSIKITVSGGSGSYQYLWNDNSQEEDRFGLSPASYSVTVTDDDNCSGTEVFVVDENAIEITLVNFSDGILTTDFLTSGDCTNIVCSVFNQDKLIYGPQEGVKSGFNVNIYEVCELCEDGNYTLELSSGNVSVSKDFNFIAKPVVSCEGFDVSAEIKDSEFGMETGEITLTISMGTPPYNYSWSDGNTDKDRVGLKADTYNLVLTDANECTISKSFVINEKSDPCIEFEVEGKVENTDYGKETGMITLSVTGGLPPYAALWNDGASTLNRDKLGEGTYSVEITDNNMCSRNLEFVIVQNPIMLKISKIHPTSTRENVAIEFMSPNSTFVDVIISDFNGFEIKQRRVECKLGVNKTTINLSKDDNGDEIPKGDYYLIVKQGEQEDKVVVTKR